MELGVDGKVVAHGLFVFMMLSVWGILYVILIPSSFIITLPHDVVRTWTHFLHNWPFVRGIHQWLVASLKRLKCSALVFSVMLGWLTSWTNSWFADDLRIMMLMWLLCIFYKNTINMPTVHPYFHCHLNDKISCKIIVDSQRNLKGNVFNFGFIRMPFTVGC